MVTAERGKAHVGNNLYFAVLVSKLPSYSVKKDSQVGTYEKKDRGGNGSFAAFGRVPVCKGGGLNGRQPQNPERRSVYRD